MATAVAAAMAAASSFWRRLRSALLSAATAVSRSKVRVAGWTSPSVTIVSPLVVVPGGAVMISGSKSARTWRSAT